MRLNRIRLLGKGLTFHFEWDGVMW